MFLTTAPMLLDTSKRPASGEASIPNGPPVVRGTPSGSGALGPRGGNNNSHGRSAAQQSTTAATTAPPQPTTPAMQLARMLRSSHPIKYLSARRYTIFGCCFGGLVVYANLSQRERLKKLFPDYVNGDADKLAPGYEQSKLQELSAVRKYNRQVSDMRSELGGAG